MRPRCLLCLPSLNRGGYVSHTHTRRNNNTKQQQHPVPWEGAVEIACRTLQRRGIKKKGVAADGAYLGGCSASQFPCAQLLLLRLSTAQSLSRACLLVGRDALVAGCLDWALLTIQLRWGGRLTCRDVGMVSSKLFPPNFTFFS